MTQAPKRWISSSFLASLITVTFTDGMRAPPTRG